MKRLTKNCEVLPSVGNTAAKRFSLLFIFILSWSLTNAQQHWLMNNPDGFSFYLTTTIDEGSFTANTRKNALIDILGEERFKGAKLKYPEIIHLDGKNESGKISGSYQAISKDLSFNGTIDNDTLKIIVESNGMPAYQLIGTKVDATVPLRDYSKSFEKVFNLTEENIYNQSFIMSQHWQQFKSTMISKSTSMLDDYEFQIAFSMIARKLPFSHYYLYASKDDKDANKHPDMAFLKELDARTCLLEVKQFTGTKEQMDSLIQIVDTKKYENLIIDLRNNPGGSHMAAFPLVEYIIDKTIIAGVFPNKNWYKEYDRLPTKEDYSKFSEFTGGSFEEWFNKAKNNYGAYFKVSPAPIHFEGQVYVLTNKRTGSTCEPIVYGLKENKYAIIIGEPTAGAMLSSNEFVFDEIFTLRIPLNDYITYSGDRIDMVGIAPDIEVKSDKALDYALKMIANNN
ncbi:MAG: S41 family peptidase [Fulvivirga sp.]